MLIKVDELVTEVIGVVVEVLDDDIVDIVDNVVVFDSDSLANSRPYQPSTIAITMSAISIKAPAKYLPESFFLLDIPHTTQDSCQRL